jgi:hypothetical protein
MLMPNDLSRNIAAILMVGCASLLLAGTAGAVDLRDWGRKLPASERFAVLAQFNNQAVLDKETQLVWERTPDTNYRNWLTADYNCARRSTGGRLGWRLPTRYEFMTLLDPAVTDGTHLPAGHPFNGIQTYAAYWTSTPSPYPDDADRVVSVAIGDMDWHVLSKDSSVFVRQWCVRGRGE